MVKVLIAINIQKKFSSSILGQEINQPPQLTLNYFKKEKL
tara:strand:+ start:454 stop:573 length:120 start_codon:yes stop_codon:yes gene_type:complete